MNKLYSPRTRFKSIHITSECWFYVNKTGIDIVHEIRDNGKYIRTDTFRIPFYQFMKRVKGGKG